MAGRLRLVQPVLAHGAVEVEAVPDAVGAGAELQRPADVRQSFGCPHALGEPVAVARVELPDQAPRQGRGPRGRHVRHPRGGHRGDEAVLEHQRPGQPETGLTQAVLARPGRCRPRAARGRCPAPASARPPSPGGTGHPARTAGTAGRVRRRRTRSSSAPARPPRTPAPQIAHRAVAAVGHDERRRAAARGVGSQRVAGRDTVLTARAALRRADEPVPAPPRRPAEDPAGGRSPGSRPCTARATSATWRRLSCGCEVTTTGAARGRSPPNEPKRSRFRAARHGNPLSARGASRTNEKKRPRAGLAGASRKRNRQARVILRSTYCRMPPLR